MLKKNGTDYMLITLEPGKNADRADIWYELSDPGSPLNLLESCLSLFTSLYRKEELIELLVEYCERLDELEAEPEYETLPKRSKKKKITPPSDEPTGESE